MSEITELSKYINKSLKEEPLITCNQACSNFDCSLNINTATRNKAINLANYASGNVSHSLPQHSVVNLASNLAVKNSILKDYKNLNECLGYNRGSDSSIFVSARSKAAKALFAATSGVESLLRLDSSLALFFRFKLKTLKLQSHKGKNRLKDPPYIIAHTRNKVLGLDLALNPLGNNEDYYVLKDGEKRLNKAAKAGLITDLDEDSFTIDTRVIRRPVSLNKGTLNDFFKLG